MHYKDYLTCSLPTVHLSRGPSPISLSTQEAWPVAAAITEYINAYFKGGQHNRSAGYHFVFCVVFDACLYNGCKLNSTGFLSFPPSFLQLSGKDHG